MSFPNLKIATKGEKQRVIKTPPGGLEKVLFRPAEKLKRLFHLAPPTRPRPYSARADLKSPSLSKSPFRTVPTSPTTLAEKLRIYSPTQERVSVDTSKPVVFDRERLSEELIEVKIANNALRAENVRLKTQITVLEKEISRRSVTTEDNTTAPHMVSMLKQSVKDLKEIVRIKDEESSLIRREMKVTKLAEMEIELNSYQEECRRLANALKNKVLDSDSRKDTASEDVRQENAALRTDLDRLAKELKEEKEAANRRKKTDMQKETEIEGLKKTIEKLRGDKGKIEKENVKLKAINEQCSRELSFSKEKLLELEQQIRALNEEQTMLQTQLDYRCSHKDFAKEESTRLKETIEEMQQEKDELQTQVTSLTDALEKLTFNFDDIQSQHKATIRELTRSHCSELDMLRTDLDKEISHLKDRLEGEAKANRELLGTAAEAEKRNLHLAGMLDKSKNEEKSLREKLETQKQQLASTEQTSNSIRKETEVAQSEAMRLSLLLDSKTQEASTMRQILIRMLQPSFKHISAQMASFQHTVESLFVSRKPELEAAISASEFLRGLNIINTQLEPESIAAIIALMDNSDGNIPLSSLKEHLTIRRSSKSSSSAQSHSDVEPQLRAIIHSEELSSPSASAENLRQSTLNEAARSQLAPDFIDNFADVRVREDSEDEPELRDELKTLLRHAALRLQICRVAKSGLRAKLFPSYTDSQSEVSLQMITKSFTEFPMPINDPKSQQLFSLFLLGLPLRKVSLSQDFSASALNIDRVIGTLEESLGSWEVFTQQKERELDLIIIREITPKAAALQSLCKSSDPERTRHISTLEFQRHLQAIQVDFSPAVFRYLTVLFYSQDLVLDSVNYESFIAAYVQTISEFLLGRIEWALGEKGARLRDVLPYNSKGLARVGDVQVAFKALGLDDVKVSEIASLLTSLQPQNELNPCVHISTFESALHQPTSPRDASLADSFARSSNTSHKSSIDDLMEYFSRSLEYTEETPEKRRSLTLSETSPFLTADNLRSSGLSPGKVERKELFYEDEEFVPADEIE